MSADDYHPFIPIRRRQDRRPDGSRACRRRGPRTRAPRACSANWERMFKEPFRGITTDGGHPRSLRAAAGRRADARDDRGGQRAAGRDVARAAKGVVLSGRLAQWRHWQNTELYVENYGLRLDEVGEPLREAVMAVLRASMSPHGYELSRDVMRLNRFLGDIVGGPGGDRRMELHLLPVRRAVGERAVGLAVLRPSSGAQLLRAGLADGADAGVLGRRAELCRSRAVQGHPAVRGRGARRIEADALVLGRAAEARDRRAFHDGRRPAGGPAAFRRQPASRRRLPGQPHRALRGLEGRGSAPCNGAT